MTTATAGRITAAAAGTGRSRDCVGSCSLGGSGGGGSVGVQHATILGSGAQQIVEDVDDGADIALGAALAVL